ncbi:DNA-directed RNA polymerase II subunit RPB11 [Pancytospora epiphaga]|nr:DNA-directed RNA polymerase II subunit RPB11 [Pancytospora epiphaga]
MTRIEITPVSAIPNTIDVIVKGEGHTASSVIVERLNNDRGCDYAAYKILHPEDNFVTIRVKGNTRTAKEVLRSSISSIIKDLDDLIFQLKK